MLKREHKVSHISSEAIFAIPAMKPSKVVFAVIFCLCLMISDVKFETSSYLRSVSHEIFKPISWVIKLPSYLIDTSSNFLSSRSSLNTKLKDLEKENFKLRSSNQLMKKLSVDFERLNSLWSSSVLNEDRFIISRKNLLSSNEFQPLLVLDIGRGNDIKVNDVVISELGLVGRVSNRSLTTAEVLLIHDIRSSIPIVSESSSLHATLRGAGLERKGQLKYVKKTAKFSAGEKVYTSGLGEIFPSGILVGEIYSINDPADSEFLEIEISFSQTPLNRDYFLIYQHE
ncbi:MAG: rod shape-determining protein MreC [SAR86 cluster bacterium]|nr:rod shape-determining protein MreC [SAR86 cluster bacterium]